MNQPQLASFKKTQILYYGLFIGQALMGIVMFYIMQDSMEKEVMPPFNFIIPGAVLFGILSSRFIGQIKNNNIPTNGSIQEKLTHYQSSSILKFALMEVGNLISLVLAFVMANTGDLIWFGIGLAAFVLLMPKRDAFIETYHVKPGEEFE